MDSNNSSNDSKSYVHIYNNVYAYYRTDANGNSDPYPTFCHPFSDANGTTDSDGNTYQYNRSGQTADDSNDRRTGG